MVVPKVLIGVALLGVGLFLPPYTASVHQRPTHAVGMKHEAFTTRTITVQRGQTLTFTNDSRWIHIIGVGHDAHLATPRQQEPVSPRVLLERNQSYTTGSWNTPGTYQLTCSVHPEMNLTVVVKN